MGQIEMKCIFNIGKKISILAKAIQVSNVAHGPLVISCIHRASAQRGPALNFAMAANTEMCFKYFWKKV
jgi:hypothetical protein